MTQHPKKTYSTRLTPADTVATFAHLPLAHFALAHLLLEN